MTPLSFTKNLAAGEVFSLSYTKMFTNTGCRTAPACTIPTANTIFTLTSNVLTVTKANEYLASTSIVVSCKWGSTTVPATVTVSQTCTPVAMSWSDVTAAATIKTSSAYTSATGTALTVVPNLSSLFTIKSTTCNGGSALSKPVCSTVLPHGTSTATTYIGFATTGGAAAPDDSAIPITALTNEATGYNTTYALQCTWTKGTTATDTVPTMTVNSVWLSFAETVVTAKAAPVAKTLAYAATTENTIVYTDLFTVVATGAPVLTGCTNTFSAGAPAAYVSGTLSATNPLTIVTTQTSAATNLGLGQTYTIVVSCMYAAATGTASLPIVSKPLSITIGAATTALVPLPIGSGTYQAISLDYSTTTLKLLMSQFFETAALNVVQVKCTLESN